MRFVRVWRGGLATIPSDARFITRLSPAMIGISRLYCGSVAPSDHLRYGSGKDATTNKHRPFATRRPVVVWNCTQECNLRCRHCYAQSATESDGEELSTEQGREMIDDLAGWGVPVILFSGGEPLLRADIFDLIAHAKRAGLRTVLSTNGTLISDEVAERLRDAGADYCGVSLDGLEETNDAFRAEKGAFAKALTGIRNARAAGIKTGLRMTMHQGNVHEIGAIFDLVERERIPRVCFYHLVPTGRGEQLRGRMLTEKQTRAALDTIMDRAALLHRPGKPVEVLTVDNHADGAYLYLRLLGENRERASEAMKLLEINGGNSSGVGIGCVGSDGRVHPDQFWRSQVVGDIRERPFSEIWSDPDTPLLKMLRDRKQYLKGRCRRCRFLDICNGNLRARGEAMTGDAWGDDPGCYLTEEEIA